MVIPESIHSESGNEVTELGAYFVILLRSTGRLSGLR